MTILIKYCKFCNKRIHTNWADKCFVCWECFKRTGKNSRGTVIKVYNGSTEIIPKCNNNPY